MLSEGPVGQEAACIREATAGIFGGWLDPFPGHGRGSFYFAFPVSHLFPVTRAESVKRYRLDGAQDMTAM
jgi:hypothetical protein